MLTKEQLKARQKGIGGSDVAAILGLSNYRDIVDVWKDKTADEVIEREENQKMRWGNILEAPVADEYANQSGNKIIASDKMLKHPEISYMLANIDRFYELPDGRRGILEIKTTSKHYMSGWKYDLPMEYYCQVQHYMWIAKALKLTQLDEAHVAILASGQEFTIIPVAYDDKFIIGATGTLHEFWTQYVKTKTPPEPTNGEQVEKLFSAFKDKEIEASKEVMLLVTNLAMSTAQRLEMEKREKELKSQIKLVMRDAELLTYDSDLILTWKEMTSNRLDQKALEKDYPDLVAEYKKESSYRKMDVKIKGENDG